MFPDIIKNAGGYDTTTGLQAPYWVASSLCIFSALLGYFFLPDVDQEASMEEDVKFLEYLKSTGYDISQLGYDNETKIKLDISDSSPSSDGDMKLNTKDETFELH